MSKSFIVAVSLFCALAVVFPLQADEGHKAHGKQAMAEGKGHRHHFTAHWARTLTEDQKLRIDRMHVALKRELVVLKAREALKEKELNALTARDDADMAAIRAKIDELIAVKGEILRKRYAHIVEMRAALTPEQRISYDMAVLERSGVK